MRSSKAFLIAIAIIGLILLSSVSLLVLNPHTNLTSTKTSLSTTNTGQTTSSAASSSKEAILKSTTTTSSITTNNQQVGNSSTTSTTTTTTSTQIRAPEPKPELVKGNAYYLTTPVDMMQWNQSYFETFVQKLVSSNVTYLFVNLPNLNNDSSLNDNFTLDSLLILRFDQIVGNYTFQYIAWTGTQASPNALLGNFTYSGINETVASLYYAGFDGILVDIEPVPNDSPALVTMLKDFRTAMNNYDQSSLLAVNSMNIHYGATPGQLWSWDPQYYQNISGLVNFISPMLFESGSVNQSQYVSYAIPQIQLAEQYGKSPILFSIPDWYENSTYHDPLAENLPNAIIAFRAYIDQGYYPKLGTMMGLGIWGLDKTYVLTPGTQTKALDTTPYDWSYFITNWVETSYPAQTGTSLT